MGSIQVLSGVKREGAALFERFDIADYANKTFSMFGGKQETVTIQFQNHLIGVVMDRFGRDVSIRKRDDEHFSVRVTVAVSGQFFGWLTGLGEGACLMAPADIVEQYRNYLQNVIGNYQ